ncbi:phage tail protein [Brevibacillus sp. DP1.3A]|uniref:phage tail-collar fiber domain-containing protein n=1 Tax=Brevibacillus sp. DP1.3A TaxID=2738867 RepID=UPI00156B9D57|nr:phage tail protein [Brevibacillus sp. DP1.3A]UED76108.1 phage tail protein [Brevibacillus sp. DP1.3A]
MAQYTGMILTKKGRDLQAKAEAGATLTFTKAKIGDGQLGQGQSLENLNDLINPLKTLAINSVEAESGGLCRIRTNITNQGITQGFYVREIGLFAQDPDLGEILYAISTASAADYLPPEGGATIVNNQFDIIVIVGNASSINATITPSGLVNQEQLAKLQGQVDSLAKSVIGSGVLTGLSFTHSGLTASYTAGSAYVSGIKFDAAAGNIQLNANQGQYIYLDIDGKVKGSTDQAAAQAKCLLWYFSTNATNVITSTDRRSVIDSTQFVKQSDVATSGANKIPRLDGSGKGAFSITGDATTLGGKSVGAGANQIPTRDANSKLVADQLARLKITKSGKDANGKFAHVEYRRESDNTLFLRSILSSPDVNGNYLTDTWTYYKADGTTVAETKVWKLSYDTDGDVTSVI